MRLLRKKAVWGAGLSGILLIALVVVVIISGAFPRSQMGLATAREPAPEAQDSANGSVAVHTIRPKQDPAFALLTTAPAQVTPYDWADLEAQVAGVVEFIRKAEGSPVTAGELLVKIAVPDLDEEVKQKESIVRQREAELRLAQSNEKIASAALTVEVKNIEVARAEVDVAQATQDYRGRVFKRLQGLVADKAATQQIVDESALDYQSAVANSRRAQAALQRANADLATAQAKLDAAGADVKLKAELIDVARKDRDRAKAVVSYAKITAPFDGVVTRRNVNRGSFVQNATTGRALPLLRVERRDIVTVRMRVPDTFAAFVNNDTEAVIEMSELPGHRIHGKVTRFSPTLESEAKDKTLLVDVDLYNGSEAEYRDFIAKEKAKKDPFDDLKEGPLPLPPMVTGRNSRDFQRLYPGMYGEMKLIFRHLPNVYLIPSDAIVRQGGTPYLYLLKDGKASLVPVEVQVDDQKLARVALLNRTPNGTAKRELTANDEVIYSNQSELADGEPVKPMSENWMP